MKRFVTYLHECERGNKIKNTGFIRVNVRGGETALEVYIRNLTRATKEGEIYAVVQRHGLKGIRLGELCLDEGQYDAQIRVKTENIMDSGYSLHNIVGIGIRFSDGKYIASCWEDMYADEIARGEFRGADTVVERENVAVEKQIDLAAASRCTGGPFYEKIDLAQIRDLPSPNWHLATNSFLVHGFWNYGYLVLKKVLEEGEEILSLGVPGVFEKPEAVMAVLFGFPEFEEVSSEMVAMQKETNQETEVGTFGCWFVRLKV